MLIKKSIGTYCIALLLVLTSCVSVDKFNANIDKPRSVQELHKDIDYVQHKLVKLHPDLYHYISKTALNARFDSLRATITAPLTSKEFYFRLSPVVASIRQGHTQTMPLIKKLKAPEKKLVGKNGTTPLAKFDFELLNNKLYIIKNYSKDSTIKAGTEVIAVNGITATSIIDKYRPTFCSDGANTTFIDWRLASGFPRFFYYEQGRADSISLTLNYRDSTRTVLLKNIAATKAKPGPKKTKEQLASERAEQKKKELQGYNSLKKLYSKQLTYPVKDSSVAIMKIADFTKGNFRRFYKQSFMQLDSAHTQTLIIDLRDNTGGRLLDIQSLYSYLADTTFRFIKRSEVTSKTSLWSSYSFKGKPLLMQAVMLVGIPDIILIDTYTFLTTTKGKDNKYRFGLYETWKKKPKTNRFKGNVYVLINGGSFSASSIISSNLKGSKRATFVGTETGGADNGCVAGIMPVWTLPHSKLDLRFGLMTCEAPYKAEQDGRGIFPDKAITPTLTDRINGTDPELQWVLNNCKK